MKQTSKLSINLGRDSRHFEEELFPKRPLIKTSSYLSTKEQNLRRHNDINERYEQLTLLINAEYITLQKETPSSSSKLAQNRRFYADTSYDWACHLDVLRQFSEKCYLECVTTTQPGIIGTTADLDMAIEFNRVSIEKLNLALKYYVNETDKAQTHELLETYIKRQEFLQATRRKLFPHEDPLEIVPAPSKAERQTSSNTLTLESEVCVILAELKNDPSPCSLDSFLGDSLNTVEKATFALINSLNRLATQQFLSEKHAELLQQSEAYLQTIVELKAQSNDVTTTSRSAKRKSHDAIAELSAQRKKEGSSEHESLDISTSTKLKTPT